MKPLNNRTLYPSWILSLALLLLALGLVSQPARAGITLPFYDGFNSTLSDGALTNVDAYWNLGTTGTNANLLVAAGPMSITVGSYGMTYPGLQINPAASKGVRLINLTNSQAAGGQLTTAVTSGSAYASFLLKVTTATTTSSRVIFEMHTSASGNSSSPFFGVGIYGTNLTLYKNNGSTPLGTNSGAGLTLGTTNLVVARYTYSGSAADDTVDLWINPDVSVLGLSNAPAATLGGLGAGFTDATTLRTYWMGLLASTSVGGYEFDEFRLGTNWASVTPSSAPLAPTSLNALAANRQVTLSWTASGSDSSHPATTGYNVKRSTTSGTGYVTLTDGTNVTSSPFVDTNVNNGTLYYYVVSAVSSTADTTESPNTAQASATPSGAAVPDTAPTISSVTAGCTSLTLGWNTITNATQYYIYRKVSGGSYGSALATNVGVNSTTYVDYAAGAGTNYVYAVTSVNGNGENSQKNDSSAAVIDKPAITSSPASQTVGDGLTNIVFTATATGGGLTYQWQLSTNNGSSFADIGGATAASYTNNAGGATVPADQGKQFRCIVNGSTCSLSATSSVATLSVATHFRSAANNLSWPNANTWQISVSGTNNWTNSTAIPTLNDSVQIQTGHMIKIATAANAKCQSLTIDSGGTNQFSGASTARRLYIAGNVTNNGTINASADATSGSHVLEFTANGTWVGSGNISAGGAIGFTNQANTTLTLATTDGVLLKSGSSVPTIGIGGTLNAGTNVLTLNSGNLILGPGGKLQTSNTNGFAGADSTYTLFGSGGTLNLSNGIVQFSGTNNQSAAGLTGTLGSLIITNAGASGDNSVVLDSGTPLTVSGALVISAGKLNPNGLTTSTAGTLSFDSAGLLLEPAGTYGNTGSGATYPSPSYFSGSGYVTVANGPQWFKSIASGNWADTNIWQMSTDNGSTYSAATETPTSASGRVEISTNNSVVITNNLAMDEVTVDANAQLTITNNVSVTLANGPGTDLVVNGTFLNQGSNSWAGTWALNSGATYIHNSTNNATTTFIAVSNSLSATSTYIYRGSSTVATPLATGGRVYGNLIIESGDGTPYAASANSVNTLTVRGNFTLGSNATVTNSHTGAWIFQGNFTNNGTLINPGAEIYTFTGAGKVIAGATDPIPFVSFNVNSGASICLEQNVTASGAVGLSGNLLIPVNKNLTPTNKIISITGSGSAANFGGGSLTVTNLTGAPALALGDRLVIFDAPVQSGDTMVISGGNLSANLVWVNNLAVDGSIVVGVGTTTTLTASTTNSTYGQNVTFTATVAPAAGAVVPTGTVQFKVDGAALGNPVTVTNGVSPNGRAAIDVDTLLVAGSPHAVTATYVSSGSFVGSQGSLAGGLTVNKATPLVTAPTATPIVVGQPFSSSILSGGTATNSNNHASVEGGFVFSTPNGIPAQGVTNVSVIFTPSDSYNYNTAATTTSVTVNPLPTLNVSQTGNVLTFSWTGSFALQWQTNPISAGLGTNWSVYPNGDISPVMVTIDPMNPTVFFRLYK